MLIALAPTDTFDFLTGPRFDTTAALPPDARRAMARLTDERSPHFDPRGLPRQTYHVRGRLTWGVAVETAIYSRDVNAGSVGFIGTVPLPVGATVSLRLSTPDGRPVTTRARVRRCRPFAGGVWFETHAEFCLPQHVFGHWKPIA